MGNPEMEPRPVAGLFASANTRFNRNNPGMSADIVLTSEIFWQSALIAAVLDAGLIAIILRLITPDRFFNLRRPLIVSAGIFWGMLGIFIVQSFWDDYYRYFYPTWMHGWGIILFGPAIGVVLAILFYWIARRFRSHPIQAFLILVGIEALLEHLMGIYSFKIMDIPMFRGVSLFSILAFSIPEYIFYWCLIILATFLVQQGYARIMGIPGIKPI
jgi:hypothetical protein